MAPYRILSLDGGGCRAIVESTVLARLLETHPKLLEDVDLFAGASAGSILSLCFAAGFSNSEASEFYQTDVKEVFKKTLLREFEVYIHSSFLAIKEPNFG
jgi:patatin-like phospholipase/acyl hydrolase